MGIWDQRLCVDSPVVFSDRYRPTGADRFEEFEGDSGDADGVDDVAGVLAVALDAVEETIEVGRVALVGRDEHRR